MEEMSPPNSPAHTPLTANTPLFPLTTPKGDAYEPSSFVERMTPRSVKICCRRGLVLDFGHATHRSTVAVPLRSLVFAATLIACATSVGAFKLPGRRPRPSGVTHIQPLAAAEAPPLAEDGWLAAAARGAAATSEAPPLAEDGWLAAAARGAAAASEPLLESAAANLPWLDSAARLVKSDVARFAESLKSSVVEVACEREHCTVFDVGDRLRDRFDDWARAREPLARWASAQCLRRLGAEEQLVVLVDAPDLPAALAPLRREVSLTASLARSPRRTVAALFRIVALRVNAVAARLRRGPPPASFRRRVLPALLDDIDFATRRGGATRAAPASPAAAASRADVALACRRVAENTLRGDVQLYRALGDAAVAAAF